MAKRSRYYRDIGESHVPLYWLPGMFYQIKNSRSDNFRPWFFAWYPRTPCYFCDKIEIFQYSKKSTPKLWRATYVELGQDADKYNLPLGLKFQRGRARTLPYFAKKIIIYILKNFDDDNVCTSRDEMDSLVKNEIMYPYYETPTAIMDSYEDVRSHYGIRIIDAEAIWTTSNIAEEDL